jgi:hypothetical protein
MALELKPGIAPPKEVTEGKSIGTPTPSVRTERRRERRYVTNDAVGFQLLPSESRPRAPGKVLNVSRSGLRLESTFPIAKGLRLRIWLHDGTVLFGESRYCHLVSDCYHVGIAIAVVEYAHAPSGEHIQDDRLKLYRAGYGLPAAEAIQVKNHLAGCEGCIERLAKLGIVRRPELRHRVAPRLPE